MIFSYVWAKIQFFQETFLFVKFKITSMSLIFIYTESPPLFTNKCNNKFAAQSSPAILINSEHYHLWRIAILNSNNTMTP